MRFPLKQSARGERGYVLLTLMLFVALLAIGSLALVQNIEQQIKRDREEELIHRGVQYSRAVQHYFRKFGRYPNRMEDLENTNGYRSLRKRYKDPITGKDFKPLHMTDVQMSFIPVGGIPGGGLPPGGLPSAPPGGNGAAAGGDGSSQDPNSAQGPQDTNGGGDQGGPSGTGANGQNSGQPGSSAGPNQLTSQTFGGAPIVGVASASKDKSIREFNKKDHYNQWQFIYDQTSDKGGLLMTPNQPPLKGAVEATPDSGAPGTQGPNPTAGPGQQPPGNSPVQPNPQPPDQ
jgi:type II secretory pathway pseudopilin PulG